MKKIFDLGLRRSAKRGKGGMLLFLLFLTSSATVCGLWSLTLVWLQASEVHLSSSGFNRLTISSTSRTPITESDMVFMETMVKDAERVVPQVTTMIRMKNANGDFASFLATSAAIEDPIMASMPLLAGHKMTGDNQVTVSPETMRRLGYDDPADWPKVLELSIPRNGTTVEQDEQIQCQVVGLVGDLGKLGVRLPLDLMVRIRLHQSGVDQHLPLRQGLASLEEINAIHVQLPADADMDSLANWLKEAKGYQVGSPYFEHGQGRKLMSVAMSVAWPLAVMFIIVNALMILMIGVQQVHNDRERLVWLKLTGAHPLSIFCWYALPRILICGISSLSGILLASKLLEFGIQRLNQMLGLTGATSAPVLAIFSGLLGWALIAVAVPIRFQTVKRNLEFL